VSVTITDLFCGAGGSSLGAELAGGTLRLGLNHWQRAVETHAANFQHADHDCEDVASLTTGQLRRYPDSDILLASPECTNHSLAKGARRRKPQSGSLWEDGPAGDDEQDRSRATMWDVCRFAEQKLLKGRPYKIIVVENVVDAFKWGANDDGGLFDAWLMALKSLGYEHEIVWLNSMFAPPTPQSRDRMYVVLWLKGMRSPDLRFDPPAWCPYCEAIVEGRQAWKRPERRPWGRYGAQYLYTCPECNGVVLPGAFPAATAIDWALPAELIGERKRALAAATRERIRRGLEKLSREPFAIRLTHGGVPKPLTLPLVTLTQRHDVAVVMPVAGNTYERTPGNRAKAADRDPLATVHATADRAIVVPPMGTTDPRDADTQPAPTQTTTTRAALVMANTENGVPRDAEREAAQTLRTEGGLAIVKVQRNGDVRDVREPVHTVRAGGQHHGLVMGNRAHGVPRSAEESPAPTLCTGESVAVVMRNNNARGDAGQMSTPTHEPFRTFTAACHQSLVVPYERTGEPVAAERNPTHTLTTRDRLALVVPHSTAGIARNADDEPLGTLTTQNKTAIVEAEGWSDDDIDACRFRMFALHEIANAMVMADHVDGGEYVVLGNKRERMAQYGNAVTPPVMRLIVERCLEVLG
jgi:DNA (cytosine-5)-methyltransferase 1